ncbi:MAG: hypothetical protein HY537_02635 [Deltaproteobacteria bacterium]|nr:hypothetical protein [Deltaproteobacteria bacterium]
MNQPLFCFLLCAIVSSQCLSASGTASAGTHPPIPVTPVYSKTGKKTIDNYRAIFESNIKTAHANSSAAQRNIEKLEIEVRILNELEKEISTLQKEYEQFLANAFSESTKNDKEYERLVKWEEELAKREPAANMKMEQDLLLREKINREQWRKDTLTKVAQAREGMANLREIDKKIGPKRKELSAEIISWKAKQSQAQTMAEEFIAKRQELEKLVTK